MIRCIAALIAGIVFGIGLVIAQMTHPSKVIAFLDVAGDWDPSLLIVMGSGLFVAMIGYKVILKQSRPLLDATFFIPSRTDIDRPLVLGAVVFGVGWGIAGYCPGPAIAALASGTSEPLLFCLAMAAGFALHRGFQQVSRSK